MIVATAGHIDHGKTTLVRALTGVDTDRLPEEKVRGISIDIGFAYWPVDGAGVVGFVDVPGHERFVRNMLAGVCGIDYVILVVAADDGVMPQTIEHLNIVDLLQVNRGMAVVTKIDRVTRERALEVTESVKRLIAATGLAGADVLDVSAVTGEGMDSLRERLRAAAAAKVQRDVEGRHFRFAIDRAFTIPGSGPVVTGTVFTGTVTSGDQLAVSPTELRVRIRAIQQYGQTAKRAVAGERCALNVAGAEVGELSRGNWIVAPELASATQRIDVRVQVLASEVHPLKHWTPVHVHLGTANVTARLAIRRGEAIMPGFSAQARLFLDRPMFTLHGDRFILRDQSATRTVGGGMVFDPFPPVTRRGSSVQRATRNALENADPRAALNALLAVSPGGVNVDWFEKIYNLTPARTAETMRDAKAVFVGKHPRTALPQAVVSALRDNVLASVATFHRQSPQATGAAVGDLHREIAPDLAAKAFLTVLREMADKRAIEITGSSVRAPRHVTTANPVDEDLWRRIRPALENAGFAVPPLRDLAAATAVDEKSLRDFVHRKSRTGELVRVSGSTFYPRATLARLAAIAQVTAMHAASNQFSAAQFRDAASIGRGLAIEILECLDRLGITQRVGDCRKILKPFEPILGPASPQPGQTSSLMQTTATRLPRA